MRKKGKVQRHRVKESHGGVHGQDVRRTSKNSQTAGVRLPNLRRLKIWCYNETEQINGGNLMNSKVIIGIVAAVIVVLGAGAALMMANSSDTANKSQDSAKTNQAASKTSLSALLEKGDPQKCTYSGSNEGYEYSGTAYFSSEKQMRNDYKSEREGKNRDGSMIISDGTQYFWNNDDKKGFKTAIKADDSQQSSSETSENVDTDAKFSFQCEAWTVDDSKFTPPSDVTIQDLTQLIPTGVGTGQ